MKRTPLAAHASVGRRTRRTQAFRVRPPNGGIVVGGIIDGAFILEGILGPGSRVVRA